MLKQKKEQFFQDESAYLSAIELLSDSYLDPGRVLETAFIKSDTIYYQVEGSVVQAIALSKVLRLKEYPSYHFIYLGMTAARKSAKKGEAFNCVIERLKDALDNINESDTLYAVSSLSTPFTYNYYKRFSSDIQPNQEGFIKEEYKTLYEVMFENVFGNKCAGKQSWMIKNYTRTRYVESELIRINNYLEKNNIYLFSKEIFDVEKGDRVIVLGKVDKNLKHLDS